MTRENRAQLKPLLRVAGILLAIAAGIYFVSYAREALAGHDLSTLLRTKVLAAIVILIVVYAATILTTAAAWTIMMRSMQQRASFRHLLAILATTQFGKYLPGNVAHHIGRIALAGTVGIGVPAAVLSIAYEMLLAMVASAHFAALMLLWSSPEFLMRWDLFEYRKALLAGLTAAAILILLLAPRLAAWTARLRAGEPGAARPELRLNMPAATACYLLYATGFLAIGGGLWLVHEAASPLGEVGRPGLLYFAGAFAGSWILGFVAPGAPAGLGIREAVLSALLGQMLPASEVVLLVVALRIATTAGDMFNFLIGSAAMLRSHLLRARNPVAPDGDGTPEACDGQES